MTLAAAILHVDGKIALQCIPDQSVAARQVARTGAIPVYTRQRQERSDSEDEGQGDDANDEDNDDVLSFPCARRRFDFDPKFVRSSPHETRPDDIYFAAARIRIEMSLRGVLVKYIPQCKAAVNVTVEFGCATYRPEHHPLMVREGLFPVKD
ncbi:hypothetical protein H2248_001757 [Termitomyces sp. 'cryptogamus']|nr:hypothetical protein H2248_001757 [Termitomyces sp. 'cryptogamus']